MNCENVKPRYYKGGLAITEYAHAGNWDSVRAFVVMSFPYNGNEVEQAFYRSSGHNSSDSFGQGFTDIEARGTWLPFNAIVVEVTNKETREKSEKRNSQLILKPPFYIPEKGILSRFHNDLELAKVSYLMGGGIWNTKLGKSLFAYTGLEPGCVGLNTKLIHATSYEVNKYITKAMSWNWHPADMLTFRKPTTPPFSLANPDFYTELDNRTFISEYLFYSPILFNYLTRAFPIKASNPVSGLARFHVGIPWAEPEEIFRKEEVGEAVAAAAAEPIVEGGKKRAKQGYGSRKRKSRKRKSKKRRSSKRRSSKRRSSKRRSHKRKFRK